MRLPIWVLIGLPLGLYGQSAGTCANAFQALASAGHEVAMNLRSGDITIVGTEAAVIRVTCTLADSSVKISFAADHLTIRGGPDHDMRFRIEIPRATNLRIRGSAGNLTASGILGDKDIELDAGNLTIEVGDASAYRHAEGSVLAGNISAAAFGVNHDGLFRSFRKDNPAGRYRLRAELLAGNLTLR